MRRNSRRVPFSELNLVLCGVLAICLCETGCVTSPLARPAAAFSSAAGLVVDHSANAYQAVIDLHDREQTEAGVILIEQGKPWDPHSVKPLISPAGMETRLQVLAGLKTYAQSLSDLTSGLNSKQLNAAAASVGTNLKSLSSAVQTEAGLSRAGISVGSQTANGISAAAFAIGNFLAQREMKQSVSTATREMDPNIDVLCKLLIDDIDTIGRTTRRDYEQLLVQQYGFVQDNTAQFTPADRRAEIERLPEILREEQRADATLVGLLRAITTLAETHHALADAARGTRPEALRARIADLTAAGENLGNFYQGLPVR